MEYHLQVLMKKFLQQTQKNLAETVLQMEMQSKTLDEPMHGFEQCIPLTLPPLSVIYLKCKRRKQTKAAVHTDKTPTKVTKTVRKTADKKTKTTDKKTKKKAD